MDPRSFELVTSFNAAGFDKYGRRFLETFAAHWPASHRLVVYTEELEFAQLAECRRLLSTRGPDTFAIRDLHTVDRELVSWKAQAADFPPAHGVFGEKYDYRYDAVRFANKVFALAHAGAHTKADVLVWIDADIVTHADVPEGLLASMMPDRVEVAYFGREKMYSECGFVMYRANRDGERATGIGIAGLMRMVYFTGQVFQWPEWHDSYAFDVVRTGAEGQVGLVSENLSGRHGDKLHPMIHSPLGAYIDHLKGPKAKELGHTPASELKIARDESYWREIQKDAPPQPAPAGSATRVDAALGGIPGVQSPTDDDKERAMRKRHAMILAAVEQIRPKRIIEVGVGDGVRGAQMALMALRQQPKVHYIGYLTDTPDEAVTRRHLDAVKEAAPGFTYELLVGSTTDTLHKRRTTSKAKADFAFIAGSLDAGTIVADYEALEKGVGTVVVDNLFRPDTSGRIPDVSKIGANSLIDMDPEFTVMPYGEHNDPKKDGGFIFAALRSDREVHIDGDRVNEIARAVMHKHLVVEQIAGLVDGEVVGPIDGELPQAPADEPAEETDAAA